MGSMGAGLYAYNGGHHDRRKPWRYPGVPIPYRLRSRYFDPSKPRR